MRKDLLNLFDLLLWLLGVEMVYCCVCVFLCFFLFVFVFLENALQVKFGVRKT